MNLTAALVGIALVGGMAVALQGPFVGQFMGQMDRNRITRRSRGDRLIATQPVGIPALCFTLAPFLPLTHTVW